MLARINLNSIESKKSEALINKEICHEDFMVIINEELTESIRMMNRQKLNVEKINLIEAGKKLGVNEVLKHNKDIFKTVNRKNEILLLKVQKRY